VIVNPHSSRIAQIYGYAVCLIAIVTLLIVGSSFVDAAFDLASPLRSQSYRYGPWDGNLTSFETFRATYQRDRVAMTVAPGPDGPVPVQPTDTLTTAQLRERYELLRAERLASVRYGAAQQLVKNGLMILLAIVLFATHWRWVRTRA
jgi:hypothetical protein